MDDTSAVLIVRRLRSYRGTIRSIRLHLDGAEAGRLAAEETIYLHCSEGIHTLYASMGQLHSRLVTFTVKKDAVLSFDVCCNMEGMQLRRNEMDRKEELNGEHDNS